MVVQNLSFFNKFGSNLNLKYNTSTNIWEGKIYFEGISNYLFDNENLFILENVQYGRVPWKFPTLGVGEYLEFSWSSNETANEFFLYEVVRDTQLDSEFISKIDSKVVAFSDYSSATSGTLDMGFPLQVNIAFSPTDEVNFQRTLNIFYSSLAGKVQIAQIDFYGEGIEEDVRYRTWAQNFGIRFLREDANILKDYDIKEAIPDYAELNRIRKELLVNKEQVYPYIGTYKGLSNFVNMLGYKDVLQIKEYWQNVNPRSTNTNKLIMVDISDYLNASVIDTLDLVDKNKQIREGKQFKKTEFLALVYEFTKEDGTYDYEGIPNVVETTDFTVNEIFYKLNLLNDKLKLEFLPVNVKIKDIIGEFIYFQRIRIANWNDSDRISTLNFNDHADVAIYPDINHDITLRALDPLFRMQDPGGIDFGVGRINNNGADNPFEFNQRYSTRDEVVKIIDNFKTFYNEIRDQRFPDIGKKLTWEFGDDPERVIGAPVIFTLETGGFTLADLSGVQIGELGASAPGLSPYWTLGNIDFGNYYEVNWRIVQDTPNPYSFSLRGKLIDLYELPHVLPYAGKYRIIAELYDFSGNISTFSRFVTVQSDQKPQIIGITRLEDKFNYQLANLTNVRLQDFGATPFYYPKVNVLNNEDAAVKFDVYKNLLEWIAFYKNRYGMGQNLYDVELYDTDLGQYVAYTDPAQRHPKKLYWGLGNGDMSLTLNDFNGVTLDSLYWLRMADCIYLDDFEAGFYLDPPHPGTIIRMSLYSDYVVPTHSTLDELIGLMNASDHPGINRFNYAIVGDRIHAQANHISKEEYQMLFYPGSASPGGSPYFSPVPSPYTSPGGSPFFPGSMHGDKYTYFLPRKVYSQSVLDYLANLAPMLDIETLFLNAPLRDQLSGAVQDPNYWVEKNYWRFSNDLQNGFLPTFLDQNAFNIADIKMFNESFAIPQESIVFFVVNNLDGKNDFIWTLIDSVTGLEVVRAKSVPFFVWKFKDLGTFTLKVEVIDNSGSHYINEVQNYINVLDKRMYIAGTEQRLNQRKADLIKSGL